MQSGASVFFSTFLLLLLSTSVLYLSKVFLRIVVRKGLSEPSGSLKMTVFLSSCVMAFILLPSYIGFKSAFEWSSSPSSSSSSSLFFIFSFSLACSSSFFHFHNSFSF